MDPRSRATVPLSLAVVAALAAALVGAGTTYVVMKQQDDGPQRVSDQSTTSAGTSVEDNDNDSDESQDLLGDLLDGETDAQVSGDLLQCLTPMPSGGDGLSGTDLTAQVAAIEEIISTDRGFASDDYDIEFVTMDEVQRRAVDLTERELDRGEAAVDARVLSALGALSPDTDLAQAQLDALDAGVAGFYNPETRELVIGSESMDGMGVFVTSHELVHAMADSTFGLPDPEQIADQTGSDAAFAALSAIEGDASLYGQRFIAQHLPLDQLLELGADSLGAQSAAGLPHFVQRDLEFPYVEGLAFSCSIYLDDGWDGVDATYDNVPTTTAQVLFPERYRSGVEAVAVRTPNGPDGWELIESDQFGAADLLFLLEAPGDDTSRALDNPTDRVAAWAGGEVHAWGNDDDTAVGVVLADRGAATPLCDSLTTYYSAAFPEATRDDADNEIRFAGTRQHAVIRCDENEVALGIGPNTDVASEAIS